MADPTDTAARLRALPALSGDAPPWDPAAAPPDPSALLLEWMHAAVAARVLDAHALTLSTVDADGVPDARVLILKDVDGDGRIAVAGSADSTLGRQLGERPVAAATFWWPELIRSVRLRGRVEPAAAAVSAADFLDRGRTARAVAAVGAKSAPMADPAAYATEVRRAEGSQAVPAAWTRWYLRPFEVEFWQGTTDRQHLRLRYTAVDAGWSRSRLRP